MSPDPGETGRRSWRRAMSRCAHRRPGLPDHRGGAGPDRTRRATPREFAGDRVGRRLGLRVEGGLDLPGDRVDRLGVLADRVERAVFAPACDVGDRLAADVEADRAEHAVGDAVDEDLGLLAPVLLVADAVGMCDLMGQGPDLLVRGSGGDDDLAALGVTPAAGTVLGEVADLDRVPELGGVLR